MNGSEKSKSLFPSSFHTALFPPLYLYFFTFFFYRIITLKARPQRFNIIYHRMPIFYPNNFSD